MENKSDLKMKVEIWSDIVCPWCYIGKRRFEEALSKFEGAEFIEVEYKSYQLSPDTKTDTSINIYEYLAQKKGIDLDQSEAMHEHVTAIAESVGLDYNFDKTIPINTLKAHCMLHFAKKDGKQLITKERLMKAYFTEGKNLDDINTLIELGLELNLDTVALKTSLESKQYEELVKKDIMDAYQLGVRGVPFFVFDRKYGVSGAQESEAFLQTLQESLIEWKKNNPEAKLEVINGKICTPDGKCE